MRACDVPLTAVSTPSGMIWEWLVMLQGLSNAPATLNRLVTRAEHGKSDVENHVEHLRAVLECMRTNKLDGNLDKCVFGAEEIPFLGCFIGKRGLRADPANVKAIVKWPVPKNQKDLRKRLGLANYLHKYSTNYAEMARPLSNLLRRTHLDAEKSDTTKPFRLLRRVFSEHRYLRYRTRIVRSASSVTPPISQSVVLYYKQTSTGVNALSRLSLASSKLQRRTIQFTTKS
ncbi:hypothetical protein PC128_g27185 [Phytophthora cactorum]|nr:hypothetical protein PC128_g27185 [Phytophthora cactorum]